MQRKGPARSGGRIISVMLAVLMAAFLFTGCGGQQGAAPGGQSGAQDYKAALEECVRGSLDADALETLSEITVIGAKESVTVSIRTYTGGGVYLPAIIEQSAGPVFEKAEELGVTITEYKVQEYTKTNSGETLDMIVWKSKDGITGTYSDSNDSGGEPVVETGVTLDRLREIVG